MHFLVIILCKKNVVVKYASQPKGSNKKNFYIAISVQVVT